MNRPEMFLTECQRIHAEIERLRNVILESMKSHRETLSDIADRLDQILQRTNRTYENDQPVVLVDCRRWSDFSEMSKGASLVAFETDMWNVFSINSSCKEFVFRYAEKLPLPSNDGPPTDSIFRKVPDLNPLSLKHWLSDELDIPEDKIIEGNFAEFSQRRNDEVDEERHDTILEYYKRI